MTLRLNGSTSGYVEIDAPATAGSNTLVLPTGNGSNGQYLQTNGSGALSWATVAPGMTASGPSFRATKTSAQSLSNNTATLINWDAKSWDTASCFNLSNDRFTPNVAGYYLLHFRCIISPVNGVNIEMWGYIRKNGTDDAVDLAPHLNYGGYQSVGVALIVYANGTTDYFEAVAYQYNSSGSSYNITAASQYASFEGALIRPA